MVFEKGRLSNLLSCALVIFDQMSTIFSDLNNKIGNESLDGDDNHFAYDK